MANTEKKNKLKTIIEDKLGKVETKKEEEEKTENDEIKTDNEEEIEDETPQTRRRGRPVKYIDNTERIKAMLEQKKTYIDTNKDKLKEKRQLRATLNNIPILKQKLINANKAIYKLVKDEDLTTDTLKLNESIYKEAQKILHPLKH
jgi:hypothetical protein